MHRKISGSPIAIVQNDQSEAVGRDLGDLDDRDGAGGRINFSRFRVSLLPHKRSSRCEALIRPRRLLCESS